MFTINVRNPDGTETLYGSKIVDVEMTGQASCVLGLDEDDITITDEHTAFIMNASGKTVRIVGKRR
jgi:hypothetical protein